MNVRHGDTSIEHRFSAAAHTYDTFAHIQRKVANILITEGPPLEGRLRILDAGCGTGYLTRRLASKYPDARIDAFDASARMIDIARSHGPVCPRISWHWAGFDDFKPAVRYDFIVSSAALHWVQSLEGTLQRLAGHLHAGGCMLAALMVKGTLAELHAARRRVTQDKAPRVDLPDVETVRRAFASCGAKTVRDFEKTCIEHHPSAQIFLQALHAMGLTGGAATKDAPLLVRSELGRLVADYDRHYAEPGRGVRATYEVLFIHAEAFHHPVHDA